jgi:hypothetical protein
MSNPITEVKVRRAVELLIAFLLAVLVIEIAVGIANAAPVPAGVRWTGDTTCTDGSIQYAGPYRIYDNAWLEPSQCVTGQVLSRGAAITITSNATPGGTVVAYPSIRYGAFYTDGDPQSGLPLPVTQLGRMTLHVASTGRAGGAWQSDADIYLHPTAASIPHHHATFELVISNRSAWRQPGGRSAVVRVAGIRYRWVTPWTTCQRNASDQCDARIPDWQITVFFRLHEKAKALIYVPGFTWFLIRHGALPRRDVLASAAYGTELWSGGRGLTDSMYVTYPKGNLR